jgi:hypothetical protein
MHHDEQMTWQKGQSLIQTIFTCVLLQRVEHIENPFLKSYLLSVLRVTSAVIMDITHSGVSKAIWKRTQAVISLNMQ